MRYPLRFIAFLLIALTAIAGVTHYSKLSFLKNPLLETLGNSVGRTIDASQLTVEIGTEIGTEIVVTITDLQIAPPAWQSSAQFVVVPRAQIKARISELLESPPRLQSIEITSPTITLINDELNGGNWAFPSAALTDESQDDKATQSLPMTVANLSVTDALISYLDAELGPTKTARLSLQQTMDDASVSSRIEGDINEFRDVLNLPSVISGPVSITMAIENGAEAAKLSGSATTSIAQITLDGLVSKQADFTGTSATLELVGVELADVTKALSLPMISDGPWRLSTNLDVREHTLALSNIALRTENAELFGESEVNRRFDEATVILNTDNARPWLAQIELPANFNAARLEQSLNAKAKLLLLDEGITVEQMRVQLGASVAEGNLTLLGPDSLAANISFKIDNLLSFAEKPPESAKLDRLSLSGTVHASLSPGQLSVEELSISMEDGTAVTARGDVQFSDSFDNTHFDVNANIAHLASFSHLAGYALPSQPLTLRTSLRASAGVLSAETFELKSGESDINGKLRITDPNHPNIQLILRSKHVDLKPWIPERQNLKDAPKKAGSAKPRVFDDAPIDIEFLTTFDAMLDIKIDKLSTRVSPFSNIVLKATNTDGRLIIEEARSEDNDGGKISIEGKVEQRQDDIAVNLALLGEGINVGIPAVSLEEAMALPRYDLDAFLYTQGNTARELAAGSNGYFEVQSGPGRVGKITAGLLTKDFFSELLALVNPFSKKQDHTDIECIALSGSIEQGKLTGDPALVVVTPALDIIAKGRIDLGSEKLFGTFNTVPKKGVGLSATKALNPFVGVGGTLAKPALTLDPQGTIIQGGMAFFTGGLSILAKSFYDRLANSTDPCGDAMEQNAKGREQALKSYQLWSNQTAAE